MESKSGAERKRPVSFAEMFYSTLFGFAVLILFQFLWGWWSKGKPNYESKAIPAAFVSAFIGAGLHLVFNHSGDGTSEEADLHTDAVVLASEEEGRRLSDALKERKIPHSLGCRMLPTQNMIAPDSRPWGTLSAPREYHERIAELLSELRED
jgi:hypothetical protein